MTNTTKNDAMGFDIEVPLSSTDGATSNIESQSVDFSQVADGFLTTVSPTILGDLNIAGKTGNRRKSQRSGLDEFHASIKEHGFIQAVVARPDPTNPNSLELIAGYGRRDAATLLKIDVPVLIRHVNDDVALRMHIDENDKRSNLSLVDEIEQAKEYTTLFKGDRKSVAQRLGWTLKRVNERLELGNCTSNVIEALDAAQIKPAQALILAHFPENIQNNTVVKCVAEKWDINTLKQRAGVAQSPLESAVFDKTDCSGCNHNTGDQAGLFDLTSNTDKCSNFVCYKQKTINHTKPILEEKYGKVILLSETSDGVINTVSAINVGQLQLESGCKSCENNVAVLSDKLGSLGTVKEAQCTDKVCFEKCTKAHSAVKTSSVSNEKKTDTVKAKTSTTNKNINNKTNKPTVVVKLASAVIEHNKKLMRTVSAEHLKNDISLQKAITLASLISSTGFKTGKGIDADSTTGFEGNVRKLCKLDAILLDELITECSIFAMTKSTSHSNNFTNIMINVLKDRPEAKEVAVNGWKGETDNLTIYTKQSLDVISDKSSFNQHLTDKDGNEKAVIQLSNKSKKDYVKGLTTNGFDWSAYAPDDYIALVS